MADFLQDMISAISMYLGNTLKDDTWYTITFRFKKLPNHARGTVKDFRLYDRVLSEEEIRELSQE